MTLKWLTWLEIAGHWGLRSGQEGASQITVVLGNGDGTFRPGSTFGKFANFPVMVVGDYNRDGKVDLVVGAGENKIGFYLFVFLGEGDGTFKQQMKYRVFYPYFITTADINGDGVLDLVFVHELSNGDPSVAVMLGKGDGTFGKVRRVVKPEGGCGFAPPFALNDV
jgi:VCBS repeat protein